MSISSENATIITGAPSMPSTNAPRRSSLWSRRGPDAVERQLRAIARQGSHSAGVSHLAASALIVLFSLGSLVSLSGDALTAIIRQWQTTGGVNIVQAIGVGVSTLVVVCMDMAMLRAATVLRNLATRRATPAEKRGHQAMMVSVAIVEATTYAYMSMLYDHPASLAAWAIILARAGMAPVVAVYLSMARALPVERRDILAQAALASGTGVLRDVVTLANDAGASLADKVQLYKAADYQEGQDDAALDRLITALPSEPTPPPSMPVDASESVIGARIDDAVRTALATLHTSPDGAWAYVDHAATGLASQDASLGVRTPDETPSPPPPSGPGSPTTAPASRRQRKPSQPAILRLEPDRPRRQRATERQAAQGKAPVRTPGTNESLEAVARQAFAAGATSIAKMRKATGMGQSAAQSWVRTLKAEATGAPVIASPVATQQPLPGTAFRGVLLDDASADTGEGYAL